MKIAMLLILAFAAFLPSSAHAQEPSLTSVMEPFTRGRLACSGDGFMGVRIALISRRLSAISSETVRSETGLGCLTRRQFLYSEGGRRRNATYFEFKGSGQLIIKDAFRSSSPETRTAEFELTLGQPDISGVRDEVIPGTNILVRRTGRLDLGSLVINFSDRREQISLPDSLTIVASQNGRFIFGEIDGGSAVISIVITKCDFIEQTCF